MIPRRTKIVATLGPAVDSVEAIAGLMRAGADVLRLNLSHGEREDHQRFVDQTREARSRTGSNVAIMTDLQGPRLRVGKVRHGRMMLETGSTVVLTSRAVVGEDGVVPVSYDGLETDMEEGVRILIDDASIECVVRQVDAEGVHAEVIRGGPVGDRKGINLPDFRISSPSVTDKDLEDIAWAAGAEVDYVAVSFIRDEDAIHKVHRELERHEAFLPVVAKIELRDAVDNIKGIVAAADAIMVARGDLGIEMPLAQIPLIQKQIVSHCNRHAKPSIIATQMLESMTENARPTRAEVSDVANAILDGADAVMLSGETAVGSYPEEAVAQMDSIARDVEAGGHIESLPLEGFPDGMPIPVAVSQSAVDLAHRLEAKAIITFTTSGFTARHHSSSRPRTSILAVSPWEAIVRRMALYWGVRPVAITAVEDTEEMIELAKRAAVEEGLAEVGDVVIIAAGLPLEVSDTTNLIQVQRIKG
jgi:pyruvate kinase